MRKFITYVIIFAFLFSLVVPLNYADATNEIKVIVNGQQVKFDQPPILDENNRTLVPVRFVSEALGATVGWEQVTKSVFIEKGNTQIKLTIGKKEYLVNKVKKYMDTSPVIKNNRTLVPVRFVSEALGATVEWDQSTKTVLISSVKTPVAEDPGFDRENLDQIASTYYFEPKDGYLLFKGNVDQPYKLKETLNPNINWQVYELTKVLLSDNDYVLTMYNPDQPKRAFVFFSKGEAFARNGQTLFSFIFAEDNPFNLYQDFQGTVESFSKDAFLTMDLNALWWDHRPENWYTPFYKQKLKDSFITIFGETTGGQIFDYVFNLYLDKRKKGSAAYEGQTDTKVFGNIQVDFFSGTGSPLNFYFSYVGGGK